MNGTLVNGSTQEWHFNGVQSIGVFMNGGNDKVDLRNLTLSGVPDENGFAVAQVIVDGGAGDDSITMFNTTIDASAPPPDPDALFFPSSSVGVLLFGETSGVGDTSGTGNDFIEVSNTTIIADGGEVSGEQPAHLRRAERRGDDHRRERPHQREQHRHPSDQHVLLGHAQAAVSIYGDDNTADSTFGASTSVIGEGNDWIDVNGTQIIADSAEGSGAVFVQVFGDQNTASGTGTATIGNFPAKTGGNDTISLTNTTLCAPANFSNNSVVVDVRGDQNLSQAGVADVGGGNDSISITNFAAGASACSRPTRPTCASSATGTSTPTLLSRAASASGTTSSR